MTNEQKIAAIMELAKGFSAKELRHLEEEFDELGDERAKAECEINGHQIEDDQCGRPAHRFCLHCFKRASDIEIARQAKVNEAAASKVAVPSESLGSGSITSVTGD